MSKIYTDELTLVAILTGLWLCMVGGILFVVSKMFEYSLHTIFGKDVPWYLDLLGALILNGTNIIIWFVCLMYNVLGYSAPMFT